ncbi:MAG: malonyl-CoA decarboxylase [Gammaproteobacteria bacterium]|nr:malonyl-CoA decarboxylase [Gammaproteobacteria bacterium]
MSAQTQLSTHATTISRIVGSVVDAGRDILAKRRQNASLSAPSTELVAQCRELLEHRGEASGLALASEICDRFQTFDESDYHNFFECLATEFDVDNGDILQASSHYREEPSFYNLNALAKSVEAPRLKLFRRLNMAPNGTHVLVELRGHLLPLLKSKPHWRGVDTDLRHLFVSWFNKGFLEMRRIDWNSPAQVLEKIIDYEAVHEISGWDDLRNRLHQDRMCFAFFHPAMPDDPLVFVEIALTRGMPDAIAPLLSQDREQTEQHKFDTVVFYSISNCHPGLAGVSFGNFLIKHVVEEVRQEIPGIKTFVTLSPVPGFRSWLQQAEIGELVAGELADRVREPVTEVIAADVRDALMKLCAHYLLQVKSGTLAKDPVARFHLGNGAQLHRLNWGADLSAKGKEQSAGIMVNYLYDLDKIEVNHDAYFDQGEISASKAVRKLL